MNDIINPVEKVDQAFYFIFGFSFLFLTAVTAVMIYFVIRYRRSKHPTPVDIRGHLGLELAWTIIPTFIALARFYTGWESYTGLRNVPEGALEIEVEAQMFSWLFYYPNDKETENELVVPYGKPVKLNLTSTDVLHSLFIPAHRVKIDAIKGMTTYAWFLPDKIGEFLIMCTEFCGTGHSDMTAILKVVPKEEYDVWIEEEEEDE